MPSNTYTTVAGDTAGQIAQKYGTSVQALQQANQQFKQFVDNPNYIQAGWNLNIPGTTSGVTTSTTGGVPTINNVPAVNGVPGPWNLNYASQQAPMSVSSPAPISVSGLTQDQTQANLPPSFNFTNFTNSLSGFTPQSNTNTVHVTSYRDNPDGTTTEFLSDGTTSTVRYTRNADGSLTPTEVNAQSTTSPDQYLKDYLGNQTPPENPMNTYNNLYEQYGLQEKEQKVNDLNAQLNQINTDLQASQLRVPDEGVNAAGLKARNTTLEREATIRALPIQAQLAAAQGNLKLAQDRLDTVFKIQSEYTTELFNYNQKLRDAVFQFADTQQQKQLQQQQQQESKNVSVYNATISDLRAAATSATNNGQVDLAAKIASLTNALSPYSKTFEQDLSNVNTQLANYQGQIRVTGTMRAIVDPATGQVTYYYVKPPAEGANQGSSTQSSPTVQTTSGYTPQQGITPQVIAGAPSYIQSSLEAYPGGSYIDMGKLSAQAQIVGAQKFAAATGTPLLSKEDANAVQSANQSYQSATALINQIRNLTQNVITAGNNPISQSVQAANLYRIEKLPFTSTNNNAKQFISARQSLLSLITRAAGEKGVLTDSDVARISNALPGYSDNQQLAAQKANNLDSVVRSVFDGAVRAYITNSGTNATNTSGATTIMTGPDGKRYNVPNEKVNLFKQNGYF